MGMEAGGKKGGLMASMNIVPLIDILLVLLIIFMVITPLNELGLHALVPQPAPPTDNGGPMVKSIVVQVLDNGEVKINDEDSTWDSLGPRLTDIFNIRAEKVAFIEGDDTVRFSDVAKAIGIMKASGIESVGLITAKMDRS
jgi:biopolymer transport protein TolR